MKFEIYEEGKEEVTKIRLIRSEWGSVYVAAVDDDGKPLDGGHIVCLTEDGELSLCRGVDSKLGFQVDEKNRIKIV